MAGSAGLIWPRPRAIADAPITLDRDGGWKEASVKANQMVGVVALVLAAVLLGSAYQSSHAPLSQMSGGFSGDNAVEAMWYLLGGIGVALGGGLLAIFGRRL